MDYRRLGRLAVRVSPLCLGTMNFGGDEPGTTERDAFDIMGRALDVGINLLRLQTDHIDLYQMHHVDRCAP